MPVRKVTIDDFTRLEGEDIQPLHDALKEICPGLAGDALWEKLRGKYGLGARGPGDRENWVERMNTAISIWNKDNPTDCISIKRIYAL